MTADALIAELRRRIAELETENATLNRERDELRTAINALMEPPTVAGGPSPLRA